METEEAILEKHPGAAPKHAKALCAKHQRCEIARAKYTRCWLHGGTPTGPRTVEGLELPRGARWKHGRRLVAARTNRRRTFARSHSNINTLVIGAEAGLLVNESRKAVTAV